MGAIVLNGARIGRNCLIGAGALVTEGKEFADGTLVVGSPAKAMRQLEPHMITALRNSATNYVANARRFAAGLKEWSPE
jgi:carbonic anhydrase/acetyltransferase-like protein (isoleucine patch superfamily)